MILILLGTSVKAEELDDLIGSQDLIVKKHLPELNDFILEANKNALRHQLHAGSIIKNSNLNFKRELNLDWVNELKLEEQEGSLRETELYVFASLSIPQIRLIELIKEGLHYKGLVVLRGLKNNSYKDTVTLLQSIITTAGGGLIINPTLFAQYNITKVPVILLNNPTIKKYDQVAGNISLKYALKEFAKNGELKEQAAQILGDQK